MAESVARWYVVERDGRKWEVEAASLEAAECYLAQCLKDRRPFEPGTHIRPALIR